MMASQPSFGRQSVVRTLQPANGRFCCAIVYGNMSMSRKLGITAFFFSSHLFPLACTSLLFAKKRMRPAAHLGGRWLAGTPRARMALDTVVGKVETHCGIASNLGKHGCPATRTPAPPDLAQLGPEVWRGDGPSDERGWCWAPPWATSISCKRGQYDACSKSRSFYDSCPCCPTCNVPGSCSRFARHHAGCEEADECRRLGAKSASNLKAGNS